MTGRRAFAVSAVAYAVVVGVAAATLPARVPTQFGAGDRADGWSSRGGAIVFLLLAGVLVGGLLAGIAAGVGGRLPLALVNLPDKDWWLETGERQARLRAMLAADLWWLAAGVLGLLVVVALSITVVAHEAEPRLGGWGWVLLGLVVLGSGGWIVRVLVRYRAPRGWGPPT